MAWGKNNSKQRVSDLQLHQQAFSTLLDTLKRNERSGAGFARQWAAVHDFVENADGIQVLDSLARGGRPALWRAVAEPRFTNATRFALGLARPSDARRSREGCYLGSVQPRTQPQKLTQLQKLWCWASDGSDGDTPTNLLNCRVAMLRQRTRLGQNYAHHHDYQALLRHFIRLAGDEPDECEALAKAYVKLARYDKQFSNIGRRDWRSMVLLVDSLLANEHLGQQRDPAKTVALACKLWNVALPYCESAEPEDATALAVAKVYRQVQAMYESHAYMLKADAPNLAEPAIYRAPRAALHAESANGSIMTAVPTTLPETCPGFDDLEAPAAVREFWTFISQSRAALQADGAVSPAGRTLLIEKQPASPGDTLALARALGHQAQAEGLLYFELTLAGISGKYFGESAVNVKNVMLDMEAQAAERHQPAVVVIKDVDQIMGARSVDHAGHNQVTNAMLQFINTDSAGPCRHLFIIGTTSAAHLLDAAARSRFARYAECLEPSADFRARFILQHSDNLLGPATALELANYATGVSLANLAITCRDAARTASTSNQRGMVTWDAREMSNIDPVYYESMWHQITLRKNIPTYSFSKHESEDRALIDLDLASAISQTRPGHPYQFFFRVGERVWLFEIKNFLHANGQVRMQLCDGPLLQSHEKLTVAICKTFKNYPDIEPQLVFKKNAFTHPMSGAKPASKVRMWDAPKLHLYVDEWQPDAEPQFHLALTLTQQTPANASAAPSAAASEADTSTLDNDIQALLRDN